MKPFSSASDRSITEADARHPHANSSKAALTRQNLAESFEFSARYHLSSAAMKGRAALCSGLSAVGASAPQTVRARDEFTARFVAYIKALVDEGARS